ncbi:MAG: metallophosphoesterase [Verrucomicrobiota bacterium]
MRYLVFGDVHGNLAALDAVLNDAQTRGIDGYFFVGDIVGYGPNPIECIDRLFALKQRGLLAWVAGNHELAVRGEANLALYNDEATATLRWTRRLLEDEPWAKRFIAEAALITEVNEQIFLTHDSVAEPSSGLYHRTPHNAVHELYTLVGKGGRIAFYGHTHLQRADLFDGHNILLVPCDPHVGSGIDPHPVILNDEQAGLFGTGSVGFPKSPLRLPEYLIFDDTNWQVEKYAVAYDRPSAKAHTSAVLKDVCGAAIADRIAKWL